MKISHGGKYHLISICYTNHNRTALRHEHCSIIRERIMFHGWVDLNKQKIISMMPLILFFIGTGAWGSMLPESSSPEVSRLLLLGIILIIFGSWGRKNIPK